MKKHLLKYKSPKATVDYQSGAIKIKDGLYLGDEDAARDMDFIVSNKVTHIINTVVKSIPNLFQKYGIFYLSIHWTQKQNNIFDKKNQALNQLYDFIEEAEQKGQCVLVHSLHGKSRSATVIAAYLMKKYGWSLSKTLEYLQSKKSKLKIRQNFMNELQNLQGRINITKSQTENWDQYQDESEWVLINTYKNTKIENVLEVSLKKTKKRVKWGQNSVVKNNSVLQEKGSLASYSRYLKSNLPDKQIRGILKGQKSYQQASETEFSLEKKTISPNKATIEEERLSKSQFVDNIRGYTTINNYVSGQSNLKHHTSAKSNQRFRSIQEVDHSVSKKELVKKNQSRSGSRLMPYENIISSFRSPYDSNFMSKVGTNSKTKKKEEPEFRGYTSMAVNQRPSSVGGRQANKPKTYAELIGSSSRKNTSFGSYREKALRYK